MIFHDRVTIALQVSLDPPQYNDYGEELLDSVNQTVPAEVFALDTEIVLQGAIVASRYRIVLAPTVELPARVGDNFRLGWGPFPIDPDNPFDSVSGLMVDGAIERHMMRGRLHHYELITKAIA